MTKDNIAILVTVLGLLAGAVQQFYQLRSDVSSLRLRMEYLHGSGWTAPPNQP